MNINWEVAADGTATRLVTCEDAVYWAKDGYIWNSLFTKWVKVDPIHLFFTIATRPQTKTVADEGEKWTHTHNGDICRIVHQETGSAWIKYKALLGSLVVPVEQLKPIKPKLTKAEAWDMCQDYEGHKSMKKYMYDLYEQYDII